MKFVNTYRLDSLIEGLRSMEQVADRLRDAEWRDMNWGIGYDPRGLQDVDHLTASNHMGSGRVSYKLWAEQDKWLAVISVKGTHIKSVLNTLSWRAKNEDPLDAIEETELACANAILKPDQNEWPERLRYDDLIEWAETVVSEAE